MAISSQLPNRRDDADLQMLRRSLHALQVQISGLTPDDVGASPLGHHHPWAEIDGPPATATRWPLWEEVDDKPATLAGFGLATEVSVATAAAVAAHADIVEDVHGIVDAAALIYNSDARLSDARAPLSHTHAAADIDSGTLAYGRLPTGPGTWAAAGGAVTLEGTLQSVVSSASALGLAQIGMQNTNGGKLYTLRVGSTGTLSLIDDTRAATVLTVAGSNGFTTFPSGAAFGARLGVGSGGGVDARLLNVQGPISATATTQYGVVSAPTLSTSATVWGRGVHARVAVPSGLNVADTAAFYAGSPTLTGSATRSYGLYVEDIAGAGANYAIYTVGSAPTRLGGALQAASGLFGGTSLSAFAALQVDSTTKGVLLPRMTTTQRDAMSLTPPEGTEIYNLTVHKKQTYDGTSWQDHW